VESGGALKLPQRVPSVKLIFNWTLISITLFPFARWTKVVALQWKLTFFPHTLIYFCQSIIPAGSHDYKFLNPRSRDWEKGSGIAIPIPDPNRPTTWSPNPNPNRPMGREIIWKLALTGILDPNRPMTWGPVLTLTDPWGWEFVKKIDTNPLFRYQFCTR